MPLDEAAVEAAAQALLDLGAESVVIHFLHSYLNPVHEQRAAQIVRALWPNRYVTAGHTVVAEYREYERGTTAAVNAAIQPVLHRYIERLQRELAAAASRASCSSCRATAARWRPASSPSTPSRP